MEHDPEARGRKLGQGHRYRVTMVREEILFSAAEMMVEVEQKNKPQGI